MTVNLKLHAAAHVRADCQLEDLMEKTLVADMMIRRRLTRSAKIAIYLSHTIGFTQGRMVLGSALGEVKPTVSIFRSLQNQTPIKATDFQNSVHNTPASYLSILYSNQAEILTVSDLLDNEKKVLQVGALKAHLYHGPVALFCIDALNFEEVGQMGCQRALESGTALLVEATNEPATHQATCENSMHAAYQASREGQTILEVTL